MMSFTTLLLAIISAVGPPPVAVAKPTPRDAVILLETKRHSGHFEKNNSGLDGDSSYLVIRDYATFEKTFGSVPPIGGKKQNWVDQETFKGSIVIAVIRRGPSTYSYEDITVTSSDQKTITLAFHSKAGEPGTARFATPLIISVPMGMVARVIFEENGKEVALVK